MEDSRFRLSTYDYELPQELIAQRAAEPRDSSRLLVSRADGSLEHGIFSDFPDHLEKGDVLVLNESKVIPARIYGRKPTGGKVEVLLIERSDRMESGNEGIESAGSEGNTKETWRCLLGGKRLRDGQQIELPGNASCVILEKGNGHYEAEGGGSATDSGTLPLVSFRFPDLYDSLLAYLDRHGEMPLPPYIKTRPEDRDRNRDRYQTVYADPEKKGSVAAPTAGLHFTEKLLEAIGKRGVLIAKVTLHVSIGTFRPVRTDDVREHRMDKEYCVLDRENADIINRALEAGERLIPVGTTSVKTLETVLTETEREKERDSEGNHVDGKDGYPLYKSWAGASDLFIYPPYRFRSPIHAMLTNFHLPKSTLLMLVSAYAGRERMLAAYREAVRQRYRFFSYGDAMLIYG